MVSWAAAAPQNPLAAQVLLLKASHGLLGFFLTEDAGRGANPTCSRVPSTFRLPPVSPVVTNLFLVVT